MRDMTIDEKIAVMLAYKNGKQIEFYNKNSGEWELCIEEPLFAFDTDFYRIKMAYEDIEEQYERNLKSGGYDGSCVIANNLYDLIMRNPYPITFLSKVKMNENVNEINGNELTIKVGLHDYKITVEVQLSFEDIYDLIRNHEDEDVISFIRDVRDSEKEDDFMRLLADEYCNTTKEGLIFNICKDVLYLKSMLDMED